MPAGEHRSRLWDLNTGNRQPQPPGSFSFMVPLAGPKLALVSGGKVQVFDAETGKKCRRWLFRSESPGILRRSQGPEGITALAFSGQGKRGDRGQQRQRHHLGRYHGQMGRPPWPADRPVGALALSRTGARWRPSVDDDRHLGRQERERRKHLVCRDGHHVALLSQLFFTPDADGRSPRRSPALFWDAASGEQKLALADSCRRPPVQRRWAADGNPRRCAWRAGGSRLGRCRGRRIARFGAGLCIVRAAALARSGKTCSTAANDGAIRTWDVGPRGKSPAADERAGPGPAALGEGRRRRGGRGARRAVAALPARRDAGRPHPGHRRGDGTIHLWTWRPAMTGYPQRHEHWYGNWPFSRRRPTATVRGRGPARSRSGARPRRDSCSG